MSVYTAKFENFWVELNTCPYDLPEGLKSICFLALEKSGLNVEQETAGSSVAQGGKKLSGYNVFMQVIMAQLKAQEVPAKERMTKMGGMWKALSVEEKAVWNTKALGVGSSKGSVQTKEPKVKGASKKLSGYNIFMQAMMAKLKAENVPSGERMTKVGHQWSAMTKEEKDVWNAKVVA